MTDKFECEICHGKKGWNLINGYTYDSNTNPPDIEYRESFRKCPNCNGKGYLDWIENAIVKPKEEKQNERKKWVRRKIKHIVRRRFAAMR